MVQQQQSAKVVTFKKITESRSGCAPPVRLSFVSLPEVHHQDDINAIQKLFFYLSQTKSGRYDLEEVRPIISFVPDKNQMTPMDSAIEPKLNRPVFTFKLRAQDYHFHTVDGLTLCQRNQKEKHTLYESAIDTSFSFAIGTHRACFIHTYVRTCLQALELLTGENWKNKNIGCAYRSSFFYDLSTNDPIMCVALFKAVELYQQQKKDKKYRGLNSHFATSLFQKFYHDYNFIDILDKNIIESHLRERKTRWNFQQNENNTALRAATDFFTLNGHPYLSYHHVNLADPLYCGVSPEKHASFQCEVQKALGSIGYNFYASLYENRKCLTYDSSYIHTTLQDFKREFLDDHRLSISGQREEEKEVLTFIKQNPPLIDIRQHKKSKVTQLRRR